MADDGRVDGVRVDESPAGPRVRIKAGCGGAGRLGTVVGAQIRADQWWCPVLWDDEEDPDFYKSGTLEVVGNEAEEAAERRAKALRGQLDAAQRACRHSWGDARYVPDRREGYTDPGDPPGTMGVDWRGPCYIPPATIRRWERTCAACGLTQRTERTTRIPAAGAAPGCGGEAEAPDFGQ